MHRVCRQLALVALLCLCFSCSKQPASLTQIQQQKSGEFVLTLFNDTGTVKQRANKLVLEVRNASSNELADVMNLQIQASMRMPGMGPMFGDVSSPQKTQPGRYEFDAEFSMAGQWNFIVTFDPMQRVQFNVNAQ